jgi:transposase-like protein
MTIKELLDDIERFAVGYLQTGNEKLFEAARNSKQEVFKNFRQLESRITALETANDLLNDENTDYAKALTRIALDETVTWEQTQVIALRTLGEIEND